MSIWMQSAPYDLRDGNWNERRDTLGDTVVNLHRGIRAGI